MNVPAFLLSLAECQGLDQLALNEQGACAVRLANGLTLDVQVLQACDEVRWTLPLGHPEPARMATVLAEALVGNHLLARQTCRHVALEAERNLLVLCETWRLDQLTPGFLGEHLEQFVAACEQTRERVHESGALSP
jgi:hypothetical protein